MIAFLRGWVINIASLSVFNVLVEIIMPDGKTKKFIHLITSFILVIAIISPFLKFLSREVDFEGLVLKNNNFLEQSEIEKSSQICEEEQMQQILEVYRHKLTTQIESQLQNIEDISDVDVEIIINEDYSSDTFGELQRIYLIVYLDESQESSKDIVIEPIEITREDLNNADTLNLLTKDKENVIRNKINALLGIAQEEIIISVR